MKGSPQILPSLWQSAHTRDSFCGHFCANHEYFGHGRLANCERWHSTVQDCLEEGLFVGLLHKMPKYLCANTIFRFEIGQGKVAHIDGQTTSAIETVLMRGLGGIGSSLKTVFDRNHQFKFIHFALLFIIYLTQNVLQEHAIF